ncbi:MAG: archease [Dehalococcoidales bacterium]
MEKDFEVLPHTADIGIIAYGLDMAEAFSNAARGMFSLITELNSIGETERRDTQLTAPDPESLLVAWLNELIYLFDVENIIFKRFDITLFGGTELKATSYGDKVDPARHQLKIGIKAATYHMLKIEENSGFKVQVLFDI